jgi:hypothetical protein
MRMRVTSIAGALGLAAGIASVLDCRRGDDGVRTDPHAASALASSVAQTTTEPPPTEAERLPEIRAAMEKAERDGVRMRFWRLAAGAPGADGWVTARPTRGGFECELPMTFNDFSQTAKATDGATIESSSVGGPWEGGKLSCTRQRRLDGPPMASPSLGSLREEWLAKPGTLSALDQQWEGFPALEIESKGSNARARMLMVDAGGAGLFMVVAELPEAAWRTEGARIERFLHSLKTNLLAHGR